MLSPLYISGMRNTLAILAVGTGALLSLLAGRAAAAGEGGPAYWVCASNEKSGDVSIIDPANRQVVATVPVGNRPRGIHPSPDGKFLYVALTASGGEGPPDARGAGGKKPDPSERPKEAPGEAAPGAPDGGARAKGNGRPGDGVAVVDLRERKLVKVLAAGP